MISQAATRGLHTRDSKCDFEKAACGHRSCAAMQNTKSQMKSRHDQASFKSCDWICPGDADAEWSVGHSFNICQCACGQSLLHLILRIM